MKRIFEGVRWGCCYLREGGREGNGGEILVRDELKMEGRKVLGRLDDVI